jgi:prepilin-type N-terminal cleavage/methylation domain-containing protein
MIQMKRRIGFTLIELLVVVLILAILMAIALPLYLRAVRDSNRQTCRSNMQTIANALQAYKVRSSNHLFPGQTASTDPIDLNFAGDATNPMFIGNEQDLQALPQCPTDSVNGDSDDYTAEMNADGQLVIHCTSDNTTEAEFHNTVGTDTVHGFIVGVDNQ